MSKCQLKSIVTHYRTRFHSTKMTISSLLPSKMLKHTLLDQLTTSRGYLQVRCKRKKIACIQLVMISDQAQLQASSRAWSQEALETQLNNKGILPTEEIWRRPPATSNLNMEVWYLWAIQGPSFTANKTWSTTTILCRALKYNQVLYRRMTIQRACLTLRLIWN